MDVRHLRGGSEFRFSVKCIRITFFFLVMDAQDFTIFCQSDLQCVSFAAFEDMRKNRVLCDLTINVENRSISAHRVILAAGIPFFQSLLTNGETETEITVDGLEPSALESLIQFAYSSQVSISLANVESLLRASYFLQLRGVQDACVEFLSKKLSINNAAQVLKLAQNLDNSNLSEGSSSLISKNFEEFSKSDDLLSLPFSSIKEIISRDDLNVSSEEIVFEAVMKWTKHLPKRHTMLPGLLREVRMMQLPIDYLIDHVDSEDLITSQKACRDLINELKYYHLLPKRRSSFLNLNALPRRNCGRCLYAICANGNYSYSVYRFDWNNEVWQNLASKESDFNMFYNAVVVKGMIYMFFTKEIHIFCIHTLEWKRLESTHKGIAGAAVVSYGNMIYCFGSRNIHFRNKVCCFNTQLNEWLEEGVMKTFRRNPAATSLGESIYVTGGFNGNICMDVAEKYNPSTNHWSDISPMLSQRSEHSSVSLNGKVFVCGGRHIGKSKLNTAEVYDPLTDQWNFVSSMKNIMRRRLSLVPHCGKVYACKLNFFKFLEKYNETSIEIYDPEYDQWICSFSLPPRFRACVSI